MNLRWFLNQISYSFPSQADILWLWGFAVPPPQTPVFSEFCSWPSRRHTHTSRGMLRVLRNTPPDLCWLLPSLCAKACAEPPGHHVVRLRGQTVRFRSQLGTGYGMHFFILPVLYDGIDNNYYFRSSGEDQKKWQKKNAWNSTQWFLCKHSAIRPCVEYFYQTQTPRHSMHRGPRDAEGADLVNVSMSCSCAEAALCRWDKSEQYWPGPLYLLIFLFDIRF